MNLIADELKKVSDRFDLEHDSILSWAPFYLVSHDGFMPDLTRELNELRRDLEKACIFTPRKGDVLQLYAEYNPSRGRKNIMQFRDEHWKVLTDLDTWLRTLFLNKQIDDAVIAIYVDDNDFPGDREIWEELLRMVFSFKRNCLILILGNSQVIGKLKRHIKGRYFYRKIELPVPSDEDNLAYFTGQLDLYHIPYDKDAVRRIMTGKLFARGWQDRKSLVLLRCELNWRIGTGNIEDRADSVSAFLESDGADKYFHYHYGPEKYPDKHIGF